MAIPKTLATRTFQAPRAPDSARKPADETQARLVKEREDLLTKQFASARRQLGAGRQEAGRQARRGFERLKARTGSVGGSLQKAQAVAEGEIGKQFEAAEAGLEAQEGQAFSQLKAGEQQRLAQQQQFRETLDFQKGSFAEQMSFQWAEFDENLKTNMINTSIALKDAGLGSQGNWDRLIRVVGGVLGPERVRGLGPGIDLAAENERLRRDRLAAAASRI